MPFDSTGVKIIVGDSNTGKSAIAEIINYSLGSSKCHLPDFVRIRCAWVATQWVRDNSYSVLARKVPVGLQQSTNVYHLRVDQSPEMPTARADLTPMGEGALKRFEELLGIGRLDLDDSSGSAADKFALTVRHAVPYLLLSDDVITSKEILIRGGGGTDAKARHLRETLPYFLGHVTEQVVRDRRKLARLRTTLRRLEQEEIQRHDIKDAGTRRSSWFIQEAVALGMLSSDVPANTSDEIARALQIVSLFNPLTAGDPPALEMFRLYERERELRQELRTIDERRRAVVLAIGDASEFQHAASAQSGRLEAIELLKEEEAKGVCPLCDAPLALHAEPVVRMKNALAKLRKDVGEAARDRPKLDAYLLNLDERIAKIRDELRHTKIKLEALLAAEEEMERSRSLGEARMRLGGMVELFLDATISEVKAKEGLGIADIKGKIKDLEDLVPQDAIDQAMNADSVRISTLIEQRTRHLPFSSEYRDWNVVFDWKALQVHISDKGKRLVRMASIGSDENYLALHIGFFFAMHQVFSERSRPVPALIFLDQVSRPYFPNAEFRKIVTLGPENQNVADKKLADERAKVRSIFSLLFKETRVENAPQVIVCEKALFPGDAEYEAAIKGVWAKPDGLVPSDWPPQA
jgi:hypothetical protein